MSVVREMRQDKRPLAPHLKDDQRTNRRGAGKVREPQGIRGRDCGQEEGQTTTERISRTTVATASTLLLNASLLKAEAHSCSFSKEDWRMQAHCGRTVPVANARGPTRELPQQPPPRFSHSKI